VVLRTVFPSESLHGTVSNSGMAMQPLANFHHLPSVLSQACSCDVFYGSHSDKGHRNKETISETELCLHVRVAYLASLSAFQFAWTIVVSPFWCPHQCITTSHLGAHTASSSLRISCPYLILFPPKLMSNLCFI
jgi:hypothetical protein